MTISHITSREKSEWDPLDKSTTWTLDSMVSWDCEICRWGSLSPAAVWRLSTSVLHLAWPLFCLFLFFYSPTDLFSFPRLWLSSCITDTSNFTADHTHWKLVHLAWFVVRSKDTVLSLTNICKPQPWAKELRLKFSLRTKGLALFCNS